MSKTFVLKLLGLPARKLEFLIRKNHWSSKVSHSSSVFVNFSSSTNIHEIQKRKKILMILKKVDSIETAKVLNGVVEGSGGFLGFGM